MKTYLRLAAAAAAAVLVTTAPDLRAQDSRRSLDIGFNNTGLSIGDSREWRGVRLNFRDTRLESASGLNVTIWSPTQNGAGNINGFAIGLPSTGGRNVRGISVAALGTGASENFHGIGIGGLGVGAGGDLRGLVIGGLGAGAGGSVRGIVLGGLGAGAGGNISGLVVGGLGAGVGGSFRGIGVGGLGVGGGADGTGLIIGGLGAGFGESFTGIAVAGLGVGSPSVRGLAISGLAVGGVDLAGIMIAGAVTRVRSDGSLHGAAIAPFNQIRGHQTGITVGVVNYAWSLAGVQIGAINIVRDNPRGRRLLPVINW